MKKKTFNVVPLPLKSQRNTKTQIVTCKSKSKDVTTKARKPRRWEPPFVPQYFGIQQLKRNVKPRPMPTPEDLEPQQELFRHQIKSFGYMADASLSILFNNIKPVQIHDSFSNRILKISFKNPKLLVCQGFGSQSL